MSGEDPDAFRTLLDHLKSSRGFDFSGYKRSSLERRVRRRMHEVDIDRYDEYQDHLQVTPDEFTELFNTILINVTGFFRDRAAWDYVASDVIPQILLDVPDPEPIRIWSAGCASGEEAYTAAILLTEALGEEDFRRRVKIYATDVDEDALNTARHATFTRDAIKAVPEEYAGYFEQSPLGYSFRGDLRRSVIFGRNDLVQDAPISRVDLLLSRNTLMYFTPETQARILRHFNFGLKLTGFLFLGRSEMLITHTDLFAPQNLKWRVFKKVPRHALAERLAFIGDNPTNDRDPSTRHNELLSAAFELSPVAQVAVDRNGFVKAVNEQARMRFGIGSAEVDRPLHDLQLSYRPADLRSALEQAYAARRMVEVGRVAWAIPGEEARALEVRVAPVPGAGPAPPGAIISFADVTEAARLDEEHARSKRQLETAYEELQSTVEELETTNEELHSTNEELETTNEELQSSNEELETMNEELQSANDELEAMNEEHANRTLELDRANRFVEGILGSLGIGVVVVDRAQTVQIWNANSTDLWGLRPDEVEGRHLLSLDTGFPVERLKQPVREMLNGDGQQTDLQVDAVTRRGHAVTCRVRLVPLTTTADGPYGVILLMAVDGQTMMLPALEVPHRESPA